MSYLWKWSGLEGIEPSTSAFQLCGCMHKCDLHFRNSNSKIAIVMRCMRLLGGRTDHGHNPYRFDGLYPSVIGHPDLLPTSFLVKQNGIFVFCKHTQDRSEVRHEALLNCCRQKGGSAASPELVGGYEKPRDNCQLCFVATRSITPQRNNRVVSCNTSVNMPSNVAVSCDSHPSVLFCDLHGGYESPKPHFGNLAR